MLGKLIKYELKATSHWFLPIYILALLLAPIERFTINRLDSNINLSPPWSNIMSLITASITIAFVLVLLAAAMASSLLIIYRFYKNLITNEGYLMHTLPVKTSLLIWSKALAAIIWTAVSTAVIILSIVILIIGTPGWNEFWHIFPEVVSSFFKNYGTDLNVWKIILEFVICFAISSLCSIFMLYASISIGQLITKHKILGAFGAFFLINMGIQFLSSLLMLPIFETFADNNLTSIDMLPDFFFNRVFPAVILFTFAMTALFYFITRYIFKNKLNLE